MENRRFESTRVHNNMFGYRGVEWDGQRKMYRARIEPAELGARGRWLGRFSTPEEAARAYDMAARELYGDSAYLNFPESGELQATVSSRSKGECPKGHDLMIFGYVRPDGRGMTCRACNKVAANRYYRAKVNAKKAIVKA